MTTQDFPAGNYRFIPAVFQYSSGAQANPGFEVERVRLDRLLPLAEGFARIANHIQAAGRPLTSFCACELRSPAVVSEDGFRKFNEHYVKTLAEWGLFDGATNPVARSNVCPRSIRRLNRPSTRSPSSGRAARALRPSSLPAVQKRAAEAAAIPSASCVIAIPAWKP